MPHVRPAAWITALVAAFALVASGCTLPEPGATSATTEETQEPAGPPAAEFEITPSDDATDVSVVDGVTVAVSHGELDSVTLTNDAGIDIDGEISETGQYWEPTPVLGYGRQYTLKTVATGENGEQKTDTRTFTMASPESVATPTLQTPGGYALESDREYGVGVIIVANFDTPVLDRDKALEYMTVETTPELEGGWYWLNESTAHWRPKEYYPSGTKVSVSTSMNGQDLGAGQYGGADDEAEFTIGQRRVAIADDNTKQIQVWHDQQLVRTMPTSMGKGGTSTYGNTTLHWWTQPGIYSVITKESSVVMDSSTFGMPRDSAGGYRGTFYNNVRLSHNGIYVHQNLDSLWAQGNTNISHGCLNLNTDHSKWYFDQARMGDIVEVRNTGGPKLEHWKNGDWSVPWDEWQTGGA